MPEIKIIPARDKSGDVLRVAAYARVSSDSEDQLNSYSAQIRYYTEMLSNSTDSVFVDMYADEGITGTSKDKRDDFNRLISDCRKGKIDRILAKSVSRFARNTVDSLQTVRELKALGISVYFEKENIDTAELSSEMLLAVYSQIAQEESLSISKNVKMGIHKRMADGNYKFPSAPYGYKLANGEIRIDPETSKIVQRIFNDYLNGFGTYEIVTRLNNDNIRPPIGLKWYPNVIRGIISNERYIGDALLQKSYMTDTLPFKKIINRGEREQFYVKSTHEPIISRELYCQVQDICKNRTEIFSSTKVRCSHALSRMIKCSCGTTFKRKAVNNKFSWVCRKHDSFGYEQCPIKPISEEIIYSAFVRMYNKMAVNYISILPPMIRQLQELADRQITGNSQVSAIRKEIADIKDQAHLTAKLKSQGILDEAYYTAKIKELDGKLLSLQKQLRAAADNDEETRQISELKQLMAVFESAKPLTEFDETLFAHTVEKITVMSETEICFRLTGGLELTETISRKGR